MLRRKLSAAALAVGILAGGVAMASPASAIGSTTCPSQDSNLSSMSHGLEVWTWYGNFCYAGTPGTVWNINKSGVYRVTADWNHGSFDTSAGTVIIGPSNTRWNEADFSPAVTVYNVTILSS